MYHEYYHNCFQNIKTFIIHAFSLEVGFELLWIKTKMFTGFGWIVGIVIFGISLNKSVLLNEK